MKINLESFLTVKKDLLDVLKVDQKTANSCNSKLTVNLDLLDTRNLDYFFAKQSRLQSTKLGRLLA